MTRRHDIDALRALAFGLLILYHVAMYYVAGWDWHLKSVYAAEWLQWPMRALNIWRMDLVFLVSGMAFGFLQRGHGSWTLFARRTSRLMVPLVFGMAVVVPYQPYAQAVANGSIAPGFGEFLVRYYTGGPWPRGAFDGWDVGVTWNHLWYLAYLWVYTTIAILLRPAMESAWGRSLQQAFVALRGWRMAAWPLVPLFASTILLWPHFPPTRDLVHDAWLHAVYFTFFIYGTWIGTHEGWWREVARLRLHWLCAALAAFGVYAALRLVLNAEDPISLRLFVRMAADVYLWCALLAILGWAHHALNRPWPWLAWAEEQLYPWYVLHQTVIIVLAVWLAPYSLGPALEPAAMVAGTVAICWLFTSLIRRVRWLRPLFGLKPRARPARPSPATPAHPAARSA